MILGTYRKLTPEEIDPIRNRAWIGFGPSKPDVRYDLSGVTWSIPGHPEPLIIIFQDRISDTSTISELAYTRIPYPHRLLPDTRKRLANMLVHAQKDEFLERLEEVALDLSQ